MRNVARKAVTIWGRHTDVASGTDALAGRGALADEFHVLWAIQCAYYAAPTAGALQVAFGGVVKWKVDLAAAGPFTIRFPRGLYTGIKNESMWVTLAEGSQAKDLNITYS